MDEPDQKELVSDLKAMRANLKNIFATDFANAVLPADDFNLERKKSEMYSEAKYKTLN